MPPTSVEKIEYHGIWKLEVGVDVDVLPPELSDLLVGPLDLYGPDGKLCTVTPDRLAIEAHLLPGDSHGSRDSERLWSIVERPGEDDEVAVFLVAGFAADPRCDGALWARDAQLPPPNVLHRARAEDVVAHVAEERARVLDSDDGRELADQYSRYLAEVPNAVPWSTYAEGTGQVWIDKRGDARLIVVTFGEDLSKPCFHVPAYTAARPIGDEGPWPYPLWGLPTPDAVFDADLDGRYELLFVREWGSLINLDVVSETLGFQPALPDESEMNC